MNNNLNEFNEAILKSIKSKRDEKLKEKDLQRKENEFHRKIKVLAKPIIQETRKALTQNFNLNLQNNYQLKFEEYNHVSRFGDKMYFYYSFTPKFTKGFIFKFKTKNQNDSSRLCLTFYEDKIELHVYSSSWMSKTLIFNYENYECSVELLQIIKNELIKYLECYAN